MSMARHRTTTRGDARATWSTIKHIPGIEDVNKEWKTTFEREGGK